MTDATQPLALVTGGAGFIGSHLCRALLSSGWRVRVLDNLSSGYRSRLASIDVEFIEADIRDRAAVRRAMSGVEAVLHHAALVSVVESVANPELAAEINIQGTANVFEEALAAGVKRATFASSAAVYGDAAETPQHEALPIAPLSPYGEGKAEGESLAKAITAEGLPVYIFRYFNIYGPGQDPKGAYAAVIAKFSDLLSAGQPVTLFGDGLQTRDFCFVGDVVRANMLALTQPDDSAAGQPMNIGLGRGVTLLELLDTLKDLLDVNAEVINAEARVGDIRHSVSNPSLAARLLGYQASVDLRHGLQALLTASELGLDVLS